VNAHGTVAWELPSLQLAHPFPTDPMPVGWLEKGSTWRASILVPAKGPIKAEIVCVAPVSLRPVRSGLILRRMAEVLRKKDQRDCAMAQLEARR
jgi:hypothetical protein